MCTLPIFILGYFISYFTYAAYRFCDFEISLLPFLKIGALKLVDFFIAGYSGSNCGTSSYKPSSSSFSNMFPNIPSSC